MSSVFGKRACVDQQQLEAGRKSQRHLCRPTQSSFCKNIGQRIVNSITDNKPFINIHQTKTYYYKPTNLKANRISSLTTKRDRVYNNGQQQQTMLPHEGQLHEQNKNAQLIQLCQFYAIHYKQQIKQLHYINFKFKIW